MEKALHLYQLLTGPEALPYWMALFGVSESLALIPKVKANSVFQAIFNGIKFLKEKFVK